MIDIELNRIENSESILLQNQKDNFSAKFCVISPLKMGRDSPYMVNGFIYEMEQNYSLSF